ncbi:MAG: sigma-54-dependent Fis family transcriptional regulator [Halomonadaceae bacterium]|nr:MAG: sigma-54-dependent Fis family transcriptional regulator [Halomonadaceae bacterium]
MPFISTTERAPVTDASSTGPSRLPVQPLQQSGETDPDQFPSPLLLSRCAVMKQLLIQAERVAATNATVFITGESGSGKELLAQLIHHQSQRRGQPFVAVNCGGLSPQLIDSELFGHEKGSFTGAIRDHRGVFERATGGTLFLDEITEMPVELQVKLLRVLETRRLVRVGGEREIVTDSRIIAATNRCPDQQLKQGRLRADLLFRLQVFPLHMPALRDRKEDIPDLVRVFLTQFNQSYKKNKGLTAAAITELVRYHWPGNLRELKNRLQRAYILADQRITPGHFSGLESSLASWSESSHERVSVPVGVTVAEVEKQLILATVSHCGGRKEQAAAMLGVSLKTLYNRLRLYQQQKDR